MEQKFIVASYLEEDKFIHSLEKLKEERIHVYDVFTPYPVPEVFHILKRKSRMPAVAYFIGLFAIAGILGFLYYTSVIDWPIIYGGKPYNSFPSFIVVTIVMTIFTVTLGSLFVFSLRANLLPGRDNTVFDMRSTDDFFTIVLKSETLDNIQMAETILRENGAIEIIEKEYDKVLT